MTHFKGVPPRAHIHARSSHLPNSQTHHNTHTITHTNTFSIHTQIYTNIGKRQERERIRNKQKNKKNNKKSFVSFARIRIHFISRNSYSGTNTHTHTLSLNFFYCIFLLHFVSISDLVCSFQFLLLSLSPRLFIRRSLERLYLPYWFRLLFFPTNVRTIEAELSCCCCCYFGCVACFARLASMHFAS